MSGGQYRACLTPSRHPTHARDGDEDKGLRPARVLQPEPSRTSWLGSVGPGRKDTEMPENKARKRAVRARMAETGERYTTAARRLGDIPAAPDDPAYTDLVKDDPELAEREWWLRARVRILSTYPGGRAGVWWNGDRPPQPGEELQMRQGGRAGRRIDRDAWWTSSDIDGAVIVPAEHVLVLEVTEVHAPTHKGAAMPASDVVAILGPGAAGWADQGILVISGLFDFEIRASSGELLGLVKRGGQGDTYNPPHPQEPVTYRAVIREHAEAWPAPPAVAFPAGFVPPDPARATAGERRRWGGAPVAYDRRSDRDPGYYDPCDSCTCCTRGGCHRGEESECPYSESMGDYVCPCTGG